MKVNAIRCDICGEISEAETAFGVRLDSNLFDGEVFSLVYTPMAILKSERHICHNCSQRVYIGIPHPPNSVEYEQIVKDKLNVLKRNAYKNSVNKKGR